MNKKKFVTSREFSAYVIEEMIKYYNEMVLTHGEENVRVDEELGTEYECAYCNFTVTVQRDETEQEKTDRVERQKKFRKKQREKAKEKKAAMEAKEREQYEKLKAKYG